MPWPGRARQTTDVLIVCSGNVCRSPYIAAALRAHLPGLRVESAGTAALRGELPNEHIGRALSERGISPAFEPARQLTRPMARRARLVIAATGFHRAYVVSRSPRAAGRTFTLKELARVVEPGDHGLDAVVARAAACAAVPDPVDHDDDLDDPFGMEWPAYDKMAAEVDAALAVLVPALREGSATG